MAALNLNSNFSESYIFCENISYTTRTSILSYFINILNGNFSVKFREKKIILNSVCCQIQLETLNAMMGPSGCGKSTLVKSLLSRKIDQLPDNYKGSVKVNSSRFSLKDQNVMKKVFLSFIGQKDLFYEMFTVKEVINMVFDLKYANLNLRDRILKSNSILNKNFNFKNANKNEIRQQVIDYLLNELKLISTYNTLIKNCSGGEKKRLTLAFELIAVPDILILDEPTTGLDSSTSFQIMNFLKKYTEIVGLTVVAVIHQPSFDLFSLFGNIVIQSKLGDNIFNGNPSKLLPYLDNFGFSCPKFYNPADYILDIANEDFGKVIINKLSDFQKKRHSYLIEQEKFKFNEKSDISFISFENNLLENKKEQNFISLSRIIIKSCNFYWSHLFTLTKEAIKVQLKDRLVLKLKALTIFLNLFFFHIAFGLENGKYDGCPNYDLIQKFEPSKLQDILNFNKAQTDGLISITGSLYFSVYIGCYFTAVLPSITIPSELKVFLKQRNNLWFSLPAYFFSRILSDIPIITVYVVFYSISNWYLTGLVAPTSNFILYLFTYLSFCYLIHGYAYLIGSIFIDSAEASVYLTLLSSIPLVLFSERIKLYKEFENLFIKAVYSFNFMRFSFRAFILAMYEDRCDEKHKNLFINYTLEMKDWLEYNLDVQKKNDNSTTGSGVTEQFTNSLIKLINGEYFNKDNTENPFELRSLIMNRLEFKDYQLINQYSVMIFQSIFFRALALLLIYYFTKHRIL